MFYWIPPEREEKFAEALEYIVETYGGNVYASDMVISISRNLTFTGDAKFVTSFSACATNDQENSLVWRLHVLAWAAKHAINRNIEGDFVECGVFKGFSSSVICKYLDFATLPRQFYLYDTFSGLAEETSTEQERAGWNRYYRSFDPDRLFCEVSEKFSPYPNVRIVRGTVPFSFQEAVPDKIAYLHIDMNSAQAEILALEELFPRMSPGAILVLDDFGWIANQAQTVAELEFMEARGYGILELPTGQGVVIK